MLKKKIALVSFSILLMFIQLTGLVFAETADTGYKDTPVFSDVDSSNWAYKAISWMVEQGVIAGYPDGTFKPGNTVSRAEFAKIMVLTLDLPLRNPESSTFRDISKNAWEYKYVETAKYYLTGFRTSNGDYFRSKNEAVREDMAVALVKALKFSSETPDESILNTFNDSDTISPALRKYVAIAVKHEIMKGNPVENSNLKAFRPQNPLTRAEASVLLYNLVNEQKITYEDINTVVENETPDMNEVDSAYNHTVPQVTGKVDGNRIILNWKPVNDPDFVYYKVVVSKSNPYPRYPQDGYMYVISDRNKTTAVIDSSSSYNDGDFGGKLVPGQKYYFSITAVYGDVKVPGNVVSLTCPSSTATSTSTSLVPKVTGQVSDGKIILKWNPIIVEGFQYYKVVISKNNSAPKYPDDGYLYVITDKNQCSATIDNSSAYNGGDFGQYLTPGQKYYFSVTLVYNDRKVPGNVLALTYPGKAATQTSSHTKPVVTATVGSGKITLKWQPTTASDFSYYKVVISKSNSNPKYPDDGYLYYITDKNTTTAVIDNSQGYNGGDIDGYLVPGQKYYFSITNCYSNEKIPGNALYLTFPK